MSNALLKFWLAQFRLSIYFALDFSPFLTPRIDNPLILFCIFEVLRRFYDCCLETKTWLSSYINKGNCTSLQTTLIVSLSEVNKCWSWENFKSWLRAVTLENMKERFNSKLDKQKCKSSKDTLGLPYVYLL